MRIIKFSLTLCLLICCIFSHAQIGVLDSSFSADGKQVTAFGLDDDGEAVLVQADGKILIAGASEIAGDYQMAVLRYDSVGILDSSFSQDGKVALNFDNGVSIALTLGFQAGGKILVGGYSNDPAAADTSFNFALARLLSNGSLDSTFGVNGKVSTGIGIGDDLATAMAVQSDGKILLAGNSDDGNGVNFALCRYLMGGALDTTFGQGGIVTTDFGNGDDEGEAMLLLSNGQVLIGGNSDSGSGMDFALAKYNSDGSLDGSFGANGLVTVDLRGADDNAKSLALTAGGKILLAGASDSTSGMNSDTDFALIQLNTDGSLDTGFSEDGVLVIDLAGFEDVGTSVAVQADHRILLAGDYDDGNLVKMALLCLQPNGSLDSSFGQNGLATVAHGGFETLCNAMALQADGKVLLVGETDDQDGDSDFAIARFNHDLILGTIDLGLSVDKLIIYPNPVSTSSKLRYKLLAPETINIDLFELSGKHIKGILNETWQSQGSHEIALGLPADVPTGIYVLRISSENGSISVRLLK